MKPSPGRYGRGSFLMRLMCAKRCNSSSLTNTVQLNGDTGRGCAVTRTPLKPRVFAYWSAVARDDVAGDMGGDGERADPVERPPAARLPEDSREQPGQGERPQRQEHQRMRDAAVVEQVLHRSGIAENEVQVRRRAGEKSRRDAPRNRTRFFRRCCARQ